MNMSEPLRQAIALGNSDLPPDEIREQIERLAEQAPAEEQDYFGDLLSSPNLTPLD